MTHELTFTDAELAKLPKWAQDKARLLNMRIGEAQDHVARIIANEPTRISVGRASHNGDMSTLQYLNDERVTFRLGEKEEVVVSLDRHDDPMRLEVSLQTSGCHLHVHPRVSNVLEIVLVPR